MNIARALLPLPLAVAALALPPSTATAEATCADGWQPVGDAECELVVIASGDVVLPDGVELVDALVVGGGGGGGGANRYDVEFLPGGTVKSYAGGGGGSGEVTLCLGMDVGGTVSVEIGVGGAGGDGAVDPAISTDGSDGGGSSFLDCVAAGGSGGEADSDPTTAGGAGGASGAGFAGGPAYFSGNGGGGGGAAADGDGSEPDRGGNGGQGYLVIGGCFTGSQIQLAMGGGGGASSKGKGGVNFSWNWETRVTASGGNARKHVWDADAQDWLVIDVPQVDSGDGASSSLLDTYEKYAAGDGGANSGSGGGGGVSWQPYRSSDGILYPGGFFPGGDGGSGVVVLRYSAAGAPTVASAIAFVDPTTGTVTLDLVMSDIACDVTSVTVGGTSCTDVTFVTEEKVRCTLPEGDYDGATVSVTDGGGTSSAVVAAFGGAPGAGDGDGDGASAGDGGSGNGDAASGELPATGSNGTVVLAAMLVVLVGISARRLGRRTPIRT